MKATEYVRLYCRKLGGRKNRRLRSELRRAAVKTLNQANKLGCKNTRVDLLKDGTVLGVFEDSNLNPIRFRRLK